MRGQKRRPHGGGLHQRIRRAQEQATGAESSQSNGHPRSHLAELMMSMWSWGLMSCPLMQKLALAAVNDGLGHPEVQLLANLGTQGKYPNHMHEELMRKLNPPPIAEALWPFKAHVKIGKAVHLFDHVVLLPHLLFACIYKRFKVVFIDSFCGGSTGNIRRFWTAMRSCNNPAYTNHPVQQRQEHEDKCIPIQIHADGVPVTGIQRSWGKSVEIWSWASLLCDGGTLVSNFIAYMIWTKMISEEFDVRDEFMQVFVWSLYWAYMGLHPYCDENWKPYVPGDSGYEMRGQPLAEGYFLVPWGLRGDLEQMWKVFNWPHHRAYNLCACCQANLGDIPWTDCRPNARWIQTIWKTNQDWWHDHPDAHILLNGLNIAIGMGILNWVPDHMHCKHLGTDQYFYGSVMYVLIYHIMGDSPEENCDFFVEQLKDTYKVITWWMIMILIIVILIHR